MKIDTKSGLYVTLKPEGVQTSKNATRHMFCRESSSNNFLHPACHGLASLTGAKIPGPLEPWTRRSVSVVAASSFPENIAVPAEHSVLITAFTTPFVASVFVS